MKRITWAAAVLIVAFTSAACGGAKREGAAPSTSTAAVATARPNIVLILTDDMAPSDWLYMPKTNALIGDQGMRFPNFMVTVSLCCPSRASILRGQYAHNHGILTNGGANGGFELFRDSKLEDSTIATWLKAAGYRTGLFGKYLNGYASKGSEGYVPPGWDSWASPIDGLAAYGQYNYRMNEDGKVVAHGRTAEDYLDDLIARKSVGFIERSMKEGAPFFAYIAPTAPHSPPVPARRHANASVATEFPTSIAFNEADVSDKPRYVSIRAPLTARTIEALQSFQRQRIRSLLAVDELVESVVTALERAGQLESTYIFVTSDNGWMQGEHRIPQGKFVPYDESVRVSMMVRGPGVLRGTDTSLAGNVDLAPTFAEIAGIAAPDFVDGQSALSILHGRPLDGFRRKAFLIESWLGGGDPGEEDTGISEYHGLRTRDAKYVEYATGERELYDLRSDPSEMENLAAVVSREILEGFSRVVAALKACKTSTCREAENLAPPLIVH